MVTLLGGTGRPDEDGLPSFLDEQAKSMPRPGRRLTIEKLRPRRGRHASLT